MILVFIICLFFFFLKLNLPCLCEFGNKLFTCFDFSPLFLFTISAAAGTWNVTRTCLSVSLNMFTLLFYFN